MANKKVYTLIASHLRRYDGSTVETEYTGTLEELTNVFSYTLLCGNSWNPKIKRNPKSIKGLINNINKSYQEKHEYYNNVRLKTE